MHGWQRCKEHTHAQALARARRPQLRLHPPVCVGKAVVQHMHYLLVHIAARGTSASGVGVVIKVQRDPGTQAGMHRACRPARQTALQPQYVVPSWHAHQMITNMPAGRPHSRRQHA